MEHMAPKADTAQDDSTQNEYEIRVAFSGKDPGIVQD